MEELKIYQADKEDVEVEICQLREFMSLVDCAKIPMGFQKSIKNIISSELNCLETQEKQLSNDIEIMIDRHIEADRNLNEEIEKGCDDKGMYAICPKCKKKCRYYAYAPDSYACECMDCDELLVEN